MATLLEQVELVVSNLSRDGANADIWVNGGSGSSYTPTGGGSVPSIQKLIADFEARTEYTGEYVGSGEEYTRGQTFNEGFAAYVVTSDFTSTSFAADSANYKTAFDLTDIVQAAIDAAVSAEADAAATAADRVQTGLDVVSAQAAKEDAESVALSVGIARNFMNATQFAQTEHMHRKLADISTGGSTVLNVMWLGDSLGYRVAPRLSQDYFNFWFPVDSYAVVSPEWNEITFNVATQPGAVSAGNPNGTDFTIKDDYNVSWTGTHFALTSVVGSRSMSRDANRVARCDRILIPFVTDPSAGAFKVQYSTNEAAWEDTNHVSWTDPVSDEITSAHTLTGSELIVDADAAHGGDVIILDFTATSGQQGYMIQVVHESGGTVQFIPPMFEITSSPAINTYKMFEGSNNFDDATDEATPVMSALIKALNIDVLIMQCDDNDTAWANIVPKVETAILDADLGHYPTVIMIGEGPKQDSTRQTNMENAGSEIARQASSKSWYYYNSLQLAKNWSVYESLGYSTTDPIHLDQDFYKLAADRVAVELGLDLYPESSLSTKPNSDDFVNGLGEADSWSTRVTANSGTLTANSLNVAKSLLIEMHALGIRDKIKYCLPLLGADLNANMVPLVDDYGVGNATAYNLSDADFDESYGVQKAVGTDHYIDTGINDAYIDNEDNCSLGIYFTGHTTGQPTGVDQLSKAAIGWFGWGMSAFGVRNDEKINLDYTDGLHILNKGSQRISHFLNSELSGYTSAYSATLPISTRPLWVAAVNSFDGSSVSETDAAIGFFFYADKLTQAELAAFSDSIDRIVIQPLGR